MKRLFSFSIMIMFVFAALITACQAQPTTAPVDQVSPPAPDESGYPAPAVEEVYPPPQQPLPVYNPYPGPSEGETNYVEWSQAEAAVMNGDVAEVYQAHTMHVTLVLKDGSVLLAKEPQIDTIFQVLDQCGDPCKDVARATE